MRFSYKNFILPAILAMATMPHAAAAQEPDFAPVMLTFSGADSLSFPPSSAMDIEGAGTIEFWVQAGWTADAGYDPVIMSYQGPNGPRMAALLTSDAKALGVYAGAYYGTVPFNFADGQLHHVALIIMGDTTTVMIDGEVRDTLGFAMADVPASELSIGSLGGYSPFIGQIGQIRIWDEPIDPEVLVEFSWAPLAATGPGAHPDLASLVGASAFANPETGGFLFFGLDDPNEDVNLTAIDDDPIDDTELDLNAPELLTAE